jgi:putative NADPH-quinone reductase
MATFELTKQHASGGIYVDTETVLTYCDALNRVDVVVNQVPGLLYWSRPTPEIMRKWVDEILKGKGVKRDGARIEGQAYGRAWRFTYPVKAA